MKVSAKLNNLRIAPRKVKLLRSLVKGLDVQDAIKQLDVTVKRSSPFMKKLLESAIANGENNLGIDRENMYVYDVVVSAGMMFKRWMPKAYGRATPIRKRTSQLEIILEERIEGKNRKTKEQLEKEKKARLDAIKKEEKAAAEKQAKEEKEMKSAEKAETKVKEVKETKEIKEAKKENKTAGKAGWAKKIFNRKAGM